MGWFRRRAWYLTSIAIGLAAVAFDLHAKSLIGAGVSRIARVPQARHDGASSDVISALKQTGQSLVDRGSSVGFVGMLLGVGSVACFFVSRRRRERGHRIVPIAVWIVYFSFALMEV
jgi:hypothetical protein